MKAEILAILRKSLSSLTKEDVKTLKYYVQSNKYNKLVSAKLDEEAKIVKLNLDMTSESLETLDAQQLKTVTAKRMMKDLIMLRILYCLLANSAVFYVWASEEAMNEVCEQIHCTATLIGRKQDFRKSYSILINC